MSRRRTLAAAVAAAVLLACTLPTDACGCTPARSWVFVIGTVDAAGAPVSGARVYLDGASPATAAAMPVYVGPYPDATTDAAGAFRAPAYSMGAPGTLALRAAVVRPGAADTVRLAAGTALFRLERPDTARVTLHLP